MSAYGQPAHPRLVATFEDKGVGVAQYVGLVQFSPDGRTLAIKASDGLVLWDVATQQVG